MYLVLAFSHMYWNALAQKQAQLIPCTVVLNAKKLQFNELVFWLPVVRFKWLIKAISQRHWTHPYEINGNVCMYKQIFYFSNLPFYDI